MISSPEYRVNRVINSLLLNSSFVNNLGLMHGKMGISIFFYHLAQKNSQNIYQNYAEELINEIYDEINDLTSLDFENGLAGIGWGIEYLVQNDFVEADADEVLEDFDNKMFQQLIYGTPTEINLLNGLLGIGAYYLKRLQNSNSNDDNLQTLTNKHSLIHLIDKLEEQTKNATNLIQEPCKMPDSGIGNSKKEETEAKKQIFDLVWDYPVLIYFLAELHEQNIFNYKVELILARLIEPLAKEKNWPQRHTNRLLLILAIEKWINSKRFEYVNEEHKCIWTDIYKVKPSISREAIKNELPANNATMRYGTTGVAWLYKQLHAICNDGFYLSEAQYWYTQSFTFDETDTAYAGFFFKNEENAFGMLEGICGVVTNNKNEV